MLLGGEEKGRKAVREGTTYYSWLMPVCLLYLAFVVIFCSGNGIYLVQSPKFFPHSQKQPPCTPPESPEFWAPVLQGCGRASSNLVAPLSWSHKNQLPRGPPPALPALLTHSTLLSSLGESVVASCTRDLCHLSVPLFAFLALHHLRHKSPILNSLFS